LFKAFKAGLVGAAVNQGAQAAAGRFNRKNSPWPPTKPQNFCGTKPAGNGRCRGRIESNTNTIK